MSGAPNPVDKALREWSHQALPDHPEDGGDRRRAAAIGVLRATIRNTAEQRRQARLRRVRFLGVAAAAAALVLGGWAWHERSIGEAEVQAMIPASDGFETEVKVLSGTVSTVTGERESPLDATSPRKLTEGEEVRTQDRASAQLTLWGRASVRLGATTSVALKSTRSVDQSIALHAGHIDVEVEKDRHAGRFSVLTPKYEIRVKGTAFSVDVPDAHPQRAKVLDATNVHVRSGSVWVFAEGTKVAELGAGDSWSSLELEPLPEKQPVVQPQELEVVTPPVEVGAARVMKKRAETRGALEDRSLAVQNLAFERILRARQAADRAAEQELSREFLERYPDSPLRRGIELDPVELVRD